MRLNWSVAAGAYALVLLVLSAIPTPPATDGVPHLDKVAHLCEFAGLAWILVRARHTSLELSGQPARDFFDVWLFATGYGLLLELLQVLLPWRSADWVDAGVNAVGAALGLWIGRRRA